MSSNKKSKNRIQSFSEFEESLTSSYEPPEYVVKPAVEDKGFFMFKKAFDDQKKFFQPSIKSTNKDLEEH